MTLNFPTIPNSYAPNTKAKSAEINANFSAILTALTSGTKDAYFGALALGQATKTNTDYTILDTDSLGLIYFSTGSSTRTATLPTLADNQGRIIYIFKIDSGSGAVTIDGEGAETINGATTATLTNQYDGIAVYAGATEWSIISYHLNATTSQRGLLPPVTSMSDTLATSLGYKSYHHGTTYNGGNAPTITLSSGGGTLSSVQQGSFTPYQIQNGDWRCKFNVIVTVSSTSRTGIILAIAGITFKNTGGTPGGQAIAAGEDGATTFYRAFADKNAGTITYYHASNTTQFYMFSGDVALESKPSWAY
jgi:hypothetical protein